jgi:hypothetical protein
MRLKKQKNIVQQMTLRGHPHHEPHQRLPILLLLPRERATTRQHRWRRPPEQPALIRHCRASAPTPAGSPLGPTTEQSAAITVQLTHSRRVLDYNIRDSSFLLYHLSFMIGLTDENPLTVRATQKKFFSN